MDLEKFDALLLEPEDEFHDFKYEWYTKHKRSEMIKDIFSFINTNHREDCYLIIGVDDKHNIVGIENDSNRLNTQQITDILQKLNFANAKIPKVIIDSIDVENHIIDIITIKDTDNVPVYLKTKKVFNQCTKPIYPGQIFVRENDTNTSITETAPDYLVEELWKKRFKINTPIEEQYKYKLKDFNNWKYVEIDGTALFRYNLDPDFSMFLEQIDGNNVESYSLSQFKFKLFWNKLSLKYKDKIIKNIYVVFLDGGRFITVTPELGSIKFMSNNGNLTYQYMLRDSIEFYVENLFFNMKHGGITPNNYQKETFLKNVVLFNNDKEMNRLNKILSQKMDMIKNIRKVTNDEINYVKNNLKMEINNDSDELSDENIKYMIEQEKISRFIKNYLIINNLD